LIQVIPFLADVEPAYLGVLTRGLSDLSVLWLNAAQITARVNIELEIDEWASQSGEDRKSSLAWDGRELWLTGKVEAGSHLAMNLVLYDPCQKKVIYHDEFEATEEKFLAAWGSHLQYLMKQLRGSEEASVTERAMFTSSFGAFLEFRKGLEILAQTKNERVREKGLECLLNAVAYDPGFTEAADILMLFLIQNDLSGDFDYYIDILERLRRISGAHPRIPLVMAEIYLQFHNFEKAEQLLKELVAEFPAFTDGWIRLALFYHGANRLEDALAALESLLEHESGNIMALDLMGAIYAGMNRRDLAKDVWLKVLELEPARVNIWNNLGLLAEENQEFDQAEIYYQRAIQINDQWWGSYYNYGSFCRRQGRLEEAVDWLGQAAQLNPNQYQIFLHLGMALFDLDRFNEAQEALLQLLQIAPDNITRYQSLEMLNRFKQPEIKTGLRIRQLERLWDAAPRKHAMVIHGLLQLYRTARKHWYYWYLWGRVAEGWKCLPGATLFWRIGLKYGPGFALTKKLGLYYWEKRQDKKSLPLLRKAFQLHNHDRDVTRAYLQNLVNMGETEEFQARMARISQFDQSITEQFPEFAGIRHEAESDC
jgi:tetratricopeptide (TPR) repeat protein